MAVETSISITKSDSSLPLPCPPRPPSPASPVPAVLLPARPLALVKPSRSSLQCRAVDAGRTSYPPLLALFSPLHRNYLAASVPLLPSSLLGVNVPCQFSFLEISAVEPFSTVHFLPRWQQLAVHCFIASTVCQCPYFVVAADRQTCQCATLWHFCNGQNNCRPLSSSFWLPHSQDYTTGSYVFNYKYMDVTANTVGLNCLAVVAWGQWRYPDILYYRPAAHTNRFLWPTLEAISVAHFI